jgi:hypothetical protein
MLPEADPRAVSKAEEALVGYGSHLAMNNVPMHVIAALLGHPNGDLRMLTKYYAHLSDSYISEQLKANLPVVQLTSNFMSFLKETFSASAKR